MYVSSSYLIVHIEMILMIVSDHQADVFSISIDFDRFQFTGPKLSTRIIIEFNIPMNKINKKSVSVYVCESPAQPSPFGGSLP